MKKSVNNSLPIKQQGAALIVALVILVVITLIGAASMQSSTMELKMATSQKDRDGAFAAAEATLIAAEEWLELNNPQLEMLWDSCGATGDCFNSSCSEGLCFDGVYTNAMDEFECEVGDSTGTNQRIEFWRDSTLDVWETDGKHKTISIDGVDEEIKYIVEFLCYAAPNNTIVFDEFNPDNGEPLFRITALSQGNGDRAEVMLQSTYLLVE